MFSETSREVLAKNVTDTELRGWLECSKDFLSTVDETLQSIPIGHYASTKEQILRNLFMDARSASYDICILAESLLNDENHYFSRSLEFSIRFLWEKTIDYFYISESEDSVAQRYLDFMGVANTKDSNDHMNIKKAFEKRYGKLRGDYWSGKTREEKIDQGLRKQPKGNITQVSGVKNLFEYLNEHVHGNAIVVSYWTFDRYGRDEYEYRGQVVAGLLNFWLFHLLSEGYCRFTGRGSEANRFKFFESYIIRLVSRKIRA